MADNVALPTEAEMDTIRTTQDKETLRVACTAMGIQFSGNTGLETLRTKIINAFVAAKGGAVSPEPLLDPNMTQADPMAALMDNLAEEGGADDPTKIQLAQIPEPVPTLDLLSMDPTRIKDPILRRRVVIAKATRLVRVQIISLCPEDTKVKGMIVTALNKYLGKVSKFVPFGEGSKSGYHVQQILLDQMIEKKYVIRTEHKGENGQKYYTSERVPRYSITILPDLTQDELDALASKQAASFSIG